MCPSGGMADAAVSKTVVSRRASSTLASGTSFLGFARRPFGSPISFPAKKRPIPKEVDPIIQMQELRENRPAGAQAAMAVDTSCARRRGSPLAPARLAALDTVGQHEKRRDAPHARDASLRKRCRKKRSVIPLSQPSASSQWQRSSSRPGRRAQSPARTAARRAGLAAPARARCRPS